MTCTEGIYVDGRLIESGDCSGPRSAGPSWRTRLSRRQCSNAPEVESSAKGSGFDRCDVAVVTNIGEGDHLGLSDIETLEKLARVKKTIVNVVDRETGHAVLNAADPLVAEMADGCRGTVLFFAHDPENPRLAAHRLTGGKAVFVRDNSIILAEGEFEESARFAESSPADISGASRIPG